MVQACDSCCMPGFCASVFLVFILKVGLFHYVVDGEGGCKGVEGVAICEGLAERRKPNGGYGLTMVEIKPSGRHGDLVNCKLTVMVRPAAKFLEFSGYKLCGRGTVSEIYTLNIRSSFGTVRFNKFFGCATETFKKKTLVGKIEMNSYDL